MRIGGRERGEPDQAEDRGWVYRNCGGERVSVCGVNKDRGGCSVCASDLPLAFNLVLMTSLRILKGYDIIQDK